MWRTHPLTALVLFTICTILIAANARTHKLGGNMGPPEELGLVGKLFFFRGWPLSPEMVCEVHGLKYHPDGSLLWVPLIDGVVAGSILFAAGYTTERCIRIVQGLARRRFPSQRTDGQ